MIEIEKNIPMPTSKGKNVYPLDQMEMGDSFLIKDAKTKGYDWWYIERTRVYMLAKKQGIKVSTLFCDDGARVWRIA